jgi:transcriptional regulator with XRE-family HTH domain
MDEGWTQDVLARRLHRHRLNWSREQLASLEAGRRQDLTVTELLLLADALAVPLAQLFKGAGDIELGGTAWPIDKLRDRLSGESPTSAVDGGDGRPFSLMEEGFARQLGALPGEVRALARDLWQGRSVEEEEARRLQDQPLLASPRVYMLNDLQEAFAGLRP